MDMFYQTKYHIDQQEINSKQMKYTMPDYMTTEPELEEALRRMQLIDKEQKRVSVALLDRNLTPDEAHCLLIQFHGFVSRALAGLEE
jgi:hypothetical protein